MYHFTHGQQLSYKFNDMYKMLDALLLHLYMQLFPIKYVFIHSTENAYLSSLPHEKRSSF